MSDCSQKVENANHNLATILLDAQKLNARTENDQKIIIWVTI